MNREDYLAYQKAYREKNRDILRAKDRERYRYNKEYQKKYYKEHKENIREYYREYHRKHYVPKEIERVEPYSNNVFEVWSDINDDYCVSNYGRVWSKCTKRFIGHKTGMGYLEVIIDDKAYLVHRLVAKAFIPNPENLPEIDHIDTDKTNNVYTNLRWTDRKGNQNNPITLERFKESNKGKNKAALKAVKEKQSWKIAQEAARKRVFQYTTDGVFVKEFSSVSEAATEIGCHRSSISACCRGEFKTAKGYVWRYSDSF